MTPTRPRRIDWLALALIALLFAALSFACVIGAGIVELGKRILAALWPWFVAHSDELTIGLIIGCAIGIVVALALEGRR